MYRTARAVFTHAECEDPVMNGSMGMSGSSC